MAWQNTPFLIPLLVVGLCTACLGIYVWWNRRTPEARMLAFLMAVVAAWSLMYMLELGFADLHTKLLWAKLKYFAVSVTPTAWLLFVLQHTGRRHWLTRRNLALLTIAPLVTLAFVWTNDWHHLFWKSVSFDAADAYSILWLPVGPALWIFAVYNYMLFLLGMVLVIKSAAQSPSFRRRQAAAVIIGALAPAGGNFLYSQGLSPFAHLDLTPFGFAVTCMACAWALYRFRLVDVVPMAYNAVIQSMNEAVVVLDADGYVVDLNPTAQALLGLTPSEAIGQSAKQAMAAWPELIECCRDEAAVQTDKVLDRADLRRQFELSNPLLYDRRGKRVGRLLVLSDISDRLKAENALKESEERYRMLVEQAKDLICTIDLKTGIISGTNAYGAQMLGYEPQSIVDRVNFLEIVHPEDHDKVVGRMQGLIVDKERMPNFALRLLKADGTPLHVEVNASVTYDEEGRPETFVGILRDVTEKRLAEEALKESEARYRAFVDNSLTGVCLIQDGKYEFVNRRFVEISGRSRDELRGMLFDQIVHPDDLELAKKIISRRMSGEDLTGQYQFRVVLKNGDARWVETFGAPLEYKGRPALLVNVIDITERRLAEEALELTQFAVDHSPDAVYWIAPDGRCVYANEEACRVLGYTRAELLSMTVSDIDPNVQAEGWSAVWENMKTQRTARMETLNRTKDGRVIPVEITGNYLEYKGREYLYMVAHDISNRKEAELKIQKSEERYRALFEESKDCVFITSPQGAFLNINPAGVEMFGYSSKEELLKADLRKDIYVNPEDRDPFQSMMAKRGFVKDYELLFKKKDDSLLNILVTANAVRDEKGDIVAYRGIMRDITEQKQLEQQLLQAQKMEGIGTLAGGIAHDFNNILGGILGYASFMKTRMKEDHPFFNYVNTIEAGATRAAELTSQLLAFARGGKYETRPVNLNKVVEETLKLVERTFDKSIEIVSDLHPELPTVEADAGQLQQVLMNLCVNAGDAMPAGGRLAIRTTVEEVCEDRAARTPGATARTYVVLSVGDTGMGMDEQTLQRIFEPFFTTKEDGKGTGLGLSMVYGVVRNHGGSIDVKSKPGEGATFRVYLPASQRAEAMHSPKIETPKGGDELILVVDDEEPIRALASDVLESHGYRVMAASDGAVATEIYEKHSGDIRLVILDMVMPKLGGRDAFLRMKEMNPAIRALLSTGYSQDGKAREILESGVMGFLQKPYEVNELLSAVRKVLDTEVTA